MELPPLPQVCRLSVLSLALLSLVACGSEQPSSETSGAQPDQAPIPILADIPMVTYTYDPQAGDKGVTAQDGGPGFTGEGWETNLTFPAIGSHEAIPGGSMRQHMVDWPATLRLHGKDWNSSINYMVSDFCYESLLTVHPTTLEHIPRLATHWKISEDKSTYTYRINPAARFSDGSEVTAADVVASWQLRVDPKTLDPSSNASFGKLNEPVAKTKYILEVSCNKPNWRNFLYFSGMVVFPAAEVSIPGDEYLDKFQNAYTANSGPYSVPLATIKTGESLEVQRRDDWWDQDNPAWTGMYNIGTYRHEVVSDASLAFEMIKKGELDYYLVPRAQWWVKDVPEVGAVKRGLLVPRKFYTDKPVGTSGIAINTRRAPLDDLRMRQVLQALYDRKLFVDKLYYNEYSPLTSYYQGGTYQNPDNKLFEYDEYLAEDLLDELGFTERDGDGYRLKKDGSRLSFDLTYSSKFSESSLTIYQENCKDAGIELTLSFQTAAARWQTMRAKNYDLTSTAWGALVFPNPETSFGGHLADIEDNNNVTSYSNKRVDELCKAYDEEYNVAKRIELVLEIDGLIYNQMPYVLGWYNPSQRMLFWNKYSMPVWGSARTADYSDLHSIWWVDPVKDAQLKAARADSSLTMDPGSRENRYWQQGR